MLVHPQFDPIAFSRALVRTDVSDRFYAFLPFGPLPLPPGMERNHQGKS